MNNYEIMYILRADLEEAVRDEQMAELQKILEKEGATVTSTKIWGTRDFAYPIKEQTKGTYVILKVTCEPAALKEFDRLTKIENKVLRSLVTVDQD